MADRRSSRIPQALSFLTNAVTRRSGEAEALRESEERFRNVLEVSRDLIYKLNLETGSFDYVSPSVLPLTGFSPEEFVGLGLRGVAARFHPETRGRVLAALDNVPYPEIEAGEVPEVEYRWKRKDGRYRWFRDNRSLIRDEQGRATSIVSVVTDITERKEAEEALRASEERFRLLAENAQDVIFRYRFTEPMGYEYISPAVAAMSGYTPAEWYENPHMGHELVHPDDRQAFEQMLNELHAGPHELRWIRKEGTVIWTEQRTTPIHDQTGKLVAVEGMIRDITERKEAEEALRQYERIVSSTSDMLALIDQHYVFLSVNAAYLQAFGKTADEVIGRTVTEVHGEKFFTTTIRPRAERCLTGENIRFQAWFKFPAAGRKYLDITYSPYRGPNSKVQGFAVAARDITGRKEAEEELRLRNAAVDVAANGILVAGRDGEIVWVNTAFTALTGYPFEEAIGRNPRILKSNKHDQPFYKQLWDTIVSGKVWRGEMINRRKDGSLYTEEQTITPVSDERGEITHFIAIKQDITERKRAEEALRESEERFRVLAENAQDMVYRYRMTEPRGYDFISPSATTISGYTPEEFYAEPFLMQKKIIHPDDREALEQLLRDVPTDPVELRWVRKDGAVVWTERRTVPIYDDSGELVALEGIVRDITERKQAEEALRASEERFRRLYTATPAMLHSIDREGRILDVSDHWLEVLGYERSEVIGRKVVEFKTEESRRYAEEVALPDFWKCGAARDIRYQFVRKDGEIVDILLSAIAEYDGEGNPYRTLAVLTDITERNRADEALRRQREEQQTILDSVPALIFYKDRENRFLRVNRALVEATGIPREEWEGGSAFDIFPNQAEDYWRDDKAVMESGEARRNIIEPMDTPGGTRWYRTDKIPYRNADGQIIGIIGFSADITEQKRLEEQLLCAREELEGRVERQMLRKNPYGLTFRELTILHPLAAGRSDKEIAAELVISPQTVHKHVANILAKMDASSRTEAATRALREGLLE